MKDFSLLYGPARTWLAVVGTALVAVAIGFFAQGSANAQQACLADGLSLASARQAYNSSCGEPLADCQAADGQWTCSSTPFADDASAQRSSTQSAAIPAADSTSDEEEGESPADVWARAPQSAADVPFVSLRQSPEPITEAGEELVSSNTTTSPSPRSASAPAAPSQRPEPRAEPQAAPQPEAEQNDDEQAALPVVDDQPSDNPGPCQARGDNVDEARRNYAANCSQPRRDCDPEPDGRWLCSSTLIG